MEYFVEDRCFQFDTSRGDPSITLEYERMTQQQWTLTKEGTYRQVGAHVCIYSVLIVNQFQTVCWHWIYTHA